ncbi:MAG: AmmeMemoRadiSam system radical SAM enzyme [Candidatus Micrarchaeota archaeon]
MGLPLLSRVKNGVVECLACRRCCRIAEGQAGFCGVRCNDKGKLKLQVYGKPAAVWVDPVEKKPLFHFIPGSATFSLGTFGCNFACSFCQNWDLSQSPQLLRKRDAKRWREHFEKLVAQCESLSPEAVVEKAVATGCKSIAFTYNEPAIFAEYALDVMKLARKRGLKGVFVTNGFETRECWNALEGLIDAVNIDLKAFNESFYARLCKAPDGLEGVKDSIAFAHEKGFWTEVTTLLVPGRNDSLQEMRAAAEWLASVDESIPWHVTAFHPDYELLDAPPTPVETLLKARELGLQAGLKFVYCGNIPGNDFENTFCPACRKLLVERKGFSVLGNNVVGGKCGFCNATVAGVWQ